MTDRDVRENQFGLFPVYPTQALFESAIKGREKEWL